MMVPSRNTEKPEEAGIVIVGGGPSGSQSARILSESGFDVLVLDSKMEIGSPVICADMVNLEVTGMDDIGKDTRLVVSRLKELRMRRNPTSEAVVLKPSYGENDAFNTIVERDRLDKELMSRALIAGGKLKIRAQFLGFEEDSGKVTVAYRLGDKVHRVVADYAIMAMGPPKPENQAVPSGSTTEIEYAYNRFVSGEVHPLTLTMEEAGKLTYNVPMGGNLSNILTVSRRAGDSTVEKSEADTTAGRSIISGKVPVSYPDSPYPGAGRVLNVGSFAGLHDQFFMTGFREAVISGELAAKSIIEASANGRPAAISYSEKVNRDLVPGMNYGVRLRKASRRSSGENLEKFLEYLSRFDFSEISAEEIFRAASLSDSVIDEMLPPDY